MARKKETRITIGDIRINTVLAVNNIIEKIQDLYPICSSGFDLIKVTDDDTKSLYVKVFQSQTEYKVCFKLCDIVNNFAIDSDEAVFNKEEFDVSYIELLNPLLSTLV